ncbi:HK97 family phage prohead protease, partial [Streptococcus suis]
MRFAGYAAVFDRPDRGGDVVRKGAFAASLARQEAIPLLWQHRPGVVIGRIEHLSEDQRGLRVIGELGSGTEARQVARLLGK